MSRSRAKTRLLAVGAMVLAAALVTYAAFWGIEKNLVYYLGPDELLARGQAAFGASVRLGGLVQQDSVVWQPDSLHLRFSLGLLASGPPSIVVQSHGVPPQMFQEGIGAVVEGHFDGEIFRAERLLVKHSNEYRPPEPGDKPNQIYSTLVAPSPAPAPAESGGEDRAPP